MAAVLRRGTVCRNDCSSNAIILLRKALGGFKRRVVILVRRSNYRDDHGRLSRALYEWCVLSFCYMLVQEVFVVSGPIDAQATPTHTSGINFVVGLLRLYCACGHLQLLVSFVIICCLGPVVLGSTTFSITASLRFQAHPSGHTRPSTRLGPTARRLLNFN